MPRSLAPASGQLTLERGQQLRILRTCKLGTRRNDRKLIAKAMLRAIDDHIGHRNGRWTFDLQELYDEIDVARTTGYDWFNWLIDQGFIGCDRLRDGRREVWICWGTLWECTPEGRVEAAREARDNPPAGPPVRHADDSVRQADRQSATRTASPPGGLHIRNSAPLSAPSSAPSSPSSAPADDDAKTKTTATERLIDLGVAKAEEAVERSLGLRSADETLATIEHFAAEFRLPDGKSDSANSINFLFWRLTDVGCRGQPPHGGWLKPSDEFRRARHEFREQAQREAERAAWRSQRQGVNTG